MTELTSTDIENIQSKIKRLKDSLSKERIRHYTSTCDILINLLKEERKLRPDYTIRQLALENDINENTMYKYMAWSKANLKTKKLVEEKKISPYNACHILQKVSKKDQDKIMSEAAKNKYTNVEIRKKLKDEKSKKTIKESRHDSYHHNFSRSLLTHCSKLLSMLPKISDITEPLKKEILSELKKTKTQIENAIKTLEN